MEDVINSVLNILKKMPYGETVVSFIHSIPIEIIIIGLILGFFATAAAWGEPYNNYSGIRKLLEAVYKASGVITGITCFLLGGYIILTADIMLLVYIFTLILGSVFNVLYQFLFQSLGRIGYSVLLFTGCISGVVSIFAAWLYINGQLVGFVT